MDKILSIQTIKNVFAALGAKTSDNNYAVGLFDKTTAEPKGLMGMSDFASMLGLIKGFTYVTASDFDYDFNDITSPGIYLFGGTTVNRPTSGNNGILLVYKRGIRICQFCICSTNGSSTSISIRWYWDEWTAWKNVTLT